MSPRVSMRLVLVVAACAALYLIGNARVPLWDRDEPWYAQCSQQMLRSGDWVVPRYLDGSLRTEKPPLIYWLHIASMSLFGQTGFAARLVSSTAMLTLLVVLALVVKRITDSQRALWTVLILGTGALVIAAAKMCLTDAVLLLWITTAQLCIYAIYRGRGSWWIVGLMWVMLALGGLTKGPIALVPSAMTALALLVIEYKSVLATLTNWRWRYWRIAGLIVLAAVAGLVIIAAIDGPWLYLVRHREPRWLKEVANIARRHVMTAMEGHSGFPGTYLLWIWATFFPWSLLLPTTIAMAWRHRHLPPIRFAIAAVLGPWIFQELMTTKLPHYVLPTFPFLAFLTADGLVRCIHGQYKDLSTRGFVTVVAIWAPLIGLIASVTWLIAAQFHLSLFGKDLEIGLGIPLEQLPVAAMIALSITGLMFTGSVLYFFARKQVAYAAAAMGLGFLLVIGVFYGWYIPSAHYLQLSPRTVAALRQQGAIGPQTQPGDIVTLIYTMAADTHNTIGYQEPSLPFYLGGALREQHLDDYLSRVAPEQWPPLMVLTNEIWQRTPPGIQSQLEIVSSVRGLNYADGARLLDLMVVRRKTPSQALITETVPAAN